MERYIWRRHAENVCDSGTHDEAKSVPVTVLDGDNSSPGIPTSTGGPESEQLLHCSLNSRFG